MGCRSRAVASTVAAKEAQFLVGLMADDRSKYQRQSWTTIHMHELSFGHERTFSSGTVHACLTEDSSRQQQKIQLQIIDRVAEANVACSTHP